MKTHDLLINTRKRKIELKIISFRFCLTVMKLMVLFWILQFDQQVHFPWRSSGFTIPKHKDTQLEHFPDYSHLYFSLQILFWLAKTKLKRDEQKVSVTPEKVIWKLSKRKTFSTGFDNWKMLLKRYNSMWHDGRLCNFIHKDWRTCQPKYGFSDSSDFWISFSEPDMWLLWF